MAYRDNLVSLVENELNAASDFLDAQAAREKAYAALLDAQAALLDAQAELKTANDQLSTSYEAYVDTLLVYQAAQDRAEAEKANQTITTASIEQAPVASAGIALPKTADPNALPATGFAALLAASGLGAYFANRRKLKNRKH